MNKTNFLVTIFFDDSDIKKQTNIEYSLKNKIIKELQHLIKDNEIKHFIVADDEVINNKLKEEAISIPDNATNGDMAQAIFPNCLKLKVLTDKKEVAVLELKDIIDWWNAPFKLESESQESDIEKHKEWPHQPCVNYDDGCEGLYGCPCVYYEPESEE